MTRSGLPRRQSARDSPKGYLGESRTCGRNAVSGPHAASGHATSSPAAAIPRRRFSDFYFTPLFKVGSVGFGKPGLLLLLSTIIVIGFFWLAFRSPKLVPRGMQNIGEMGILFVRDQILRPQLGKKGDRWLPFLCSLFFFIWINNIFGIIPILYFPAMSKFGYPVALTADRLGHLHGPRHEAPGRSATSRTWPCRPARPWWILPLLVPIELFSNIIVRPFTLSVRLFANMLAGHVLLLVFALATWYLLTRVDRRPVLGDVVRRS